MSARFSRSVSLLTLSLLLSLASDSQVYARWATLDEASIECLYEKISYIVKKDGSWTKESEIQWKILNESGRQALSTLTHTYDSTLSKSEILEAKTDNHGKEINVLEKIEDKPLASDALGLKKNHQILVPFECVTVGSILHLKIKEDHFKAQMENYFSNYVEFGSEYLYTHSNTVIESELPLFLKINDPYDSFIVTQNKDDSKHTIEINLKKPLYQARANEPEQSYGEPATFSSVSVSTESDYDRIGKFSAKLYQPLLTELLPEVLENIRLNASKIEDEGDCIDTIVASLIEKITYLGSWNTIEGYLAPRPLETIMQSGYGDCKEYSSGLAAILNKLGYTAKIALVDRSGVYLEKENPLPSLGQFNHAIVKAIGPSGKTYWIDPTNIVSIATGIFPDIADRPAVVLDPENPTYEHIPAIDYKRAVFNGEKIITVTNNGDAQIEGSLCLEGEAAIKLTESFSSNPFSLVKESLIKTICGNTDPINPVLNLSDVTSCKVKPFKATFSYGDSHLMKHTNLGPAFSLKESWHKPYVSVPQDNEGAVYIGDPGTTIRKYIFKNVSAKFLNNLSFSIQTPWLNAKREFSVTKEGVVFTETVEQLKSIIPSKDLKSPVFDKLKKTLRKYCDKVAIVFSE
ncbi:MAG: DUF3857 domain-containing protein [Alphaproteobacteria bacterium]|jgi:hypothetical protein|nr:DUF3857 domain-containing protein [Alphaproteobacteria bacterium]